MDSRRLATVLLIGALSVAALLVLALGIQNRRLRADLDDQRNRATRPYTGFTVPSFTAATLRGDSIAVGAPDSGTYQVLFVFNTTCPVCLRGLPAWEALTSRLIGSQGSAGRIYGISLDNEEQTRQYVVDHALAFPVLRFPDARLATLYRAVAVPLTLVVGEGGTVRYARFGALADDAAIDSIVAVTRPSTSIAAQRGEP